MKNGVDDDFAIDERASKKQKIEPIAKSIEQLLLEVHVGNYTDFRRHLIQKYCKMLNLGMMAENIDLSHLGQALQGTQVIALHLYSNNINADAAVKLANALKGTQITTLNLGGNILGADGAVKLVDALKGTQVSTLNLRYNHIGRDEAQKISTLIPGTLLLAVDLEFEHPAMKQALEENKKQIRKLMDTPYFLNALACNLTNQEKKACHSNVSPQNELALFLNPELPKELQHYIVSFLPIASFSKEVIFSYHGITPKALKQPEDTNMNVENNNINHKRMAI